MAGPVTDKTPLKLIQLYKTMAEFTLIECKSCRVPLSCCSPEYCEFTMHLAKQRGVVLETTGHPRLPMMGPDGCIAPPHLRPMCSVHTCDIMSMGYRRQRNGDEPGEADAWSRKYFDLRSQIEQEESQLHTGKFIDS